MRITTPVAELQRLARLYGVQTMYYGVGGVRRYASVASLLAVLRALGAPLETAAQVHDAMLAREQEMLQTVIEPVSVVWEQRRPNFRVLLPQRDARLTGTMTLTTEAGETREWKWRAADWPVTGIHGTGGDAHAYRSVTLPVQLPYGYHDFTLAIGSRTYRSRIIAAPRRAYQPPGEGDRRFWGAFLPLYALETRRTMGAGDFTAFGEMVDDVAAWGGNLAGTLPLLPVYLDFPYDPGPYSPVSRLLWNEFYVDVTAAPELANCPEAQAGLEAPAFREAVEAARRKRRVDYRSVMALKRGVMERLSGTCVSQGGPRLEAFRRFAADDPHAADYARFRAVMDKRHATFYEWPDEMRNGQIAEGDFDPAVRDYHLYAQWLAHEQLARLDEEAATKDVALYFDLPLGVNGAGYDVWRYGRVFSLGAATGAPPDVVFTSGQNWGFPPPLPDGLRRDGYRYVIEYIRHHFRHAGMLRVDHVMGLHRLFWIPREMRAADGVYVHYRPEEVYAILTLESHRHRCVVVGEDLGIVPGYVRRAMTRHRLERMYILHYSMVDVDGGGLGGVPRNMVAAMNTHDMPPFATFWSGDDIDLRLSLSLVPPDVAAKEKRERPVIKKLLKSFLQKHGFVRKAKVAVADVLKGSLAYLASSRARMLLVNLEDLWLETKAQNVPGTLDEHPNWQRKARYRLEHINADKDVRATLTVIDGLRKGEPDRRPEKPL
jgi:4-alpha-glucanotransferase